MAHHKLTPREKRKARIRKRITGTAIRPRMSLFRSNTALYVQVIDDEAGRTLASASTLKEGKGANKEAAKWLGATIAEKVLQQKIDAVVFDRNGYNYHGVVKELADAARAGGLKY